MRKTVIILFLAIIYYCNLQNASAQLCVAGDLKVSTVRGIAVFANGTVLEDIPIQLSKDVLGEPIIKKVRTDKNGEFSFGTLKSGQYYVIVQGIENLANLTFLVKVKKKYGKKQPLGIKIIMRAFFDCSTAETKILKKS